MDGSERRIVTTAQLPRFLKDWIEVESKRPHEDRKLPKEKVHAELQKTYKILDEVLYHRKFLGPSGELESAGMTAADDPSLPPDIMPDGQKILLSVLILAETLDNARCFIYNDDRSFTWGHPLIVGQLLKKAGWCRFEPLYTRSFPTTILYLLSSMDRNWLDRNHSNCEIGKGRCVASNVETGHYETKHCREDGCKHMTACSTEDNSVTSIILAGQIPVLRVSPNHTSGNPDLRPICSRSSTSGEILKYVAISHVWSDGLGNEKFNSLPQCQLERLQDLVDKMYEPDERPVHFWIDTICVPLEPEYRKLAISMMKRAYQEADRVLVLDRSLYGSNLAESAAEPLVRIICCPWITRLWTLQESVYARKLYFQFADRTIEFESLLRDKAQIYRNNMMRLYQEGDDSGIWRWKKENLWLLDPIMSVGQYLLDEVKPDIGKMEGLISSLQVRSTSHLEDETICLGTLLDLDVALLLQTPAESRMKQLLAKVTEFPTSIIFNRSPHLVNDGFRWAPASLLSSEKNRNFLDSTAPRGSITSRGLMVKFSGILFPKDGMPLMTRTLSFSVGERVMYKATLTQTTNLSLNGYRPEQVAIIFQHVPPVVGRIGYRAGVLATVQEFSDGIIFVRFRQIVGLEKIDSAYGLRAWAFFLPDQKWCVG